MPDLKLLALDAQDLAVISAHLQDAVLTVGDLAYLPKERSFVALANRFDWMEALAEEGGRTREFSRRRAAIRFGRVLGAQVLGLDLAAKSKALALLAVSFEPVAEPEGHVTLHFAEGGAVRLHVECIEAGLTDLGAAWQTASEPKHPEQQHPEPEKT